MARKGTREILATLQRKVGGRMQVQWTRRYARLENGIRRATELALSQGYPADVVEFALESGLQLGTVKLHVGNKLTTQWTNLGKIQKLCERNGK